MTELEAIGIVDGKPVWEGDTVYIDGVKIIAESHSLCTLREWNAAGKVSWDPPKPKTVMVELELDDAEAFAYGCKCQITDLKRKQHGAEAIRKALEKLK